MICLRLDDTYRIIERSHHRCWREPNVASVHRCIGSDEIISITIWCGVSPTITNYVACFSAGGEYYELRIS
ncbi:hypothetical protein [Nostoc sp.]|uniref:hypothetical protein n=1 Tax=Nostoc sp. TaxID=1180 RepID=UPI002FFA2162